MDLELAGKTAVITGSTQGLGKAIAVAMHREGCNVVINGRDAGAAERVAMEFGKRAVAVAADVTDPEACLRLVAETNERFGGVDVLICNVGSGRSVAPGDETYDEWRRVLELNLLSATNMVAAATGSLEKSRGTVICISSICGMEALGAPLTYSAAKAAVNAYVRGIARPLGRRGIRVNAVAPGNIIFEGSVWERKLRENPTAVKEMLEREVALGRLGRAEEIADMVAFLASPRSAFTTGAVFVSDGGQLRS